MFFKGFAHERPRPRARQVQAEEAFLNNTVYLLLFFLLTLKPPLRTLYTAPSVRIEGARARGKKLDK